MTTTDATGTPESTEPTALTTPIEPTALNSAASTIGTSFERLSTQAASAILEQVWGIRAVSLSRLDTENDDTFHVQAATTISAAATPESATAPKSAPAHTAGFVFKVAHPAERAEQVELQSAALLHAAARNPHLPLQKIIPSLTGELHPRVSTPLGGSHDGSGNGASRIGRLLTYIPGRMLQDASPTLPQLRACGRSLATLAAALADFEHPAAHRALPWDLQQLGMLQDKLPAVADDVLRAELDGTLRTLLRDTLPRLQHTRRQVIHNDFHGGNVVVDPADPDFVTGILDFGDTVASFLVADLAVAMSYVIDTTGIDTTGSKTTSTDTTGTKTMGTATRGTNATGTETTATDPWLAADALRDGYREITPLTDDELALLHPLVVGRLVQRIVLGSWLADSDPANAAYTARNLRTTLDQFASVKGAL